MLQEEIESYAEVEYIANFCKGTRDAAESGTLTENPELGPWRWLGLGVLGAERFVWQGLEQRGW